MKESPCSKPIANVEPVALPCHSSEASFSINCLLRTVRVEESVCLLSRINYCFPVSLHTSVTVAMQHAECLNRLVSQSKVHVVKDIDGDRGYFLQMDSVLRGDSNRTRLSTFFAGVTRDIETMLKYFQQEATRPQVESLSTISQGCNAASLKANVCTIA